MEGGRGILTPELGEAVDGEVRRGQVGGETGDERGIHAPSQSVRERPITQSESTLRMLPAGSVNQAMSGPWFAALPRAMPFSSWPIPS